MEWLKFKDLNSVDCRKRNFFSSCGGFPARTHIQTNAHSLARQWRKAGVWSRKPSGWRKRRSPPSNLPPTLLINITEAHSGRRAAQSHSASRSERAFIRHFPRLRVFFFSLLVPFPAFQAQYRFSCLFFGFTPSTLWTGSCAATRRRAAAAVNRSLSGRFPPCVKDTKPSEVWRWESLHVTKLGSRILLPSPATSQLKVPRLPSPVPAVGKRKWTILLFGFV